MEASSDLLLGGRYVLSRIIGSVMSIPVWSSIMLTFLLLFVLVVLLRRRSFAMAAMILGLTANYVVTHGGWLLANAPADHFAPSFADIALFAAVQTAVIAGGRPVRSAHDDGRVVCERAASTRADSLDSSVPYASSSRLIVATRDRAGRIWLAHRAGGPSDAWRAPAETRTRPPRLIRETSRFPQARIASSGVIVVSRRRS